MRRHSRKIIASENVFSSFFVLIKKEPGWRAPYFGTNHVTRSKLEIKTKMKLTGIFLCFSIAFRGMRIVVPYCQLWSATSVCMIVTEEAIFLSFERLLSWLTYWKTWVESRGRVYNCHYANVLHYTDFGWDQTREYLKSSSAQHKSECLPLSSFSACFPENSRERLIVICPDICTVAFALFWFYFRL